MTTLYRTPNIVIGAFEWHAAVRQKDGRISRNFYFRPNVLPRRAWVPMSSWKGRRPTWNEFERAFGKFKRHMTIAEQSVRENARMAQGAASHVAI